MSAEHQLSRIRNYTTRPLFGPIVNKLAQWQVDPNTVTEIACGTAKLGIFLMKKPQTVSTVVSIATGRRINLPEKLVENTGKVLWIAGVVGDGIDGELARKTNKTSDYGKKRDAEVDREVDLFGPMFDAADAPDLTDRMIAEANLATNSLPALLRSVAAIHNIQVPEFSIFGSRGVRLVTQGVGYFIRGLRRASGIALIGESVVTAGLRYGYILKKGDRDAISHANQQIGKHFSLYLQSKQSTAFGLVGTYNTWKAITDEYSNVKEEEVFGTKST